MKNGNMPAAPIFNENGYPQVARVTLDNNEAQCSGLTKREHFAGLAMQAICSHPDTWGCSTRKIAESSVEMADFLLEELEKSK